MLKLCQLSAAFWLDWLIVMLLLLPVIVALPAVTCPSIGSA